MAWWRRWWGRRASPEDGILHDSFRELRVRLHLSSPTPRDQRYLRSLTWEAYRKTPQLFEEQWRPYILAFERHEWLGRWLEHLPRLRALDLPISGGTFTWKARTLELATLQALVESEALSICEVVVLRDCGLSVEVLTRLLDAPAFAHVRALDVGGNALGPAGARALATAPSLCGLRTLDLGRNKLKLEGVGALAGAPAYTSLEHLGLSKNGLQEDAGWALGGSLAFPALTSIDVSENWLGGDGAQGLMRAEWFKCLHTLDLSENLIHHLPAPEDDVALECLSLYCNSLGGAGVGFEFQLQNYLISNTISISTAQLAGITMPTAERA